MQLIFSIKPFLINLMNATLEKTQLFRWFILMMQFKEPLSSCKLLHKKLISEPATICMVCHSHQNKSMKKLKNTSLISKFHTKSIHWGKTSPTPGLIPCKMKLRERIGDGLQNTIWPEWLNRFSETWLQKILKKCRQNNEIYFVVLMILLIYCLIL